MKIRFFKEFLNPKNINRRNNIVSIKEVTIRGDDEIIVEFEGEPMVADIQKILAYLKSGRWEYEEIL